MAYTRGACFGDASAPVDDGSNVTDHFSLLY